MQLEIATKKMFTGSRKSWKKWYSFWVTQKTPHLITQLMSTGSSPSCHRCSKSTKQWSYTFSSTPWLLSFSIISCISTEYMFLFLFYFFSVMVFLFQSRFNSHLPWCKNSHLQVLVAARNSHDWFVGIEEFFQFLEVLIHFMPRPLQRIKGKLTDNGCKPLSSCWELVDSNMRIHCRIYQRQFLMKLKLPTRKSHKAVDSFFQENRKPGTQTDHTFVHRKLDVFFHQNRYIDPHSGCLHLEKQCTSRFWQWFQVDPEAMQYKSNYQIPKIWVYMPL